MMGILLPNNSNGRKIFLTGKKTYKINMQNNAQGMFNFTCQVNP